MTDAVIIIINSEYMVVIDAVIIIISLDDYVVVVVIEPKLINLLSFRCESEECLVRNSGFPLGRQSPHGRGEGEQGQVQGQDDQGGGGGGRNQAEEEEQMLGSQLAELQQKLERFVDEIVVSNQHHLLWIILWDCSVPQEQE